MVDDQRLEVFTGTYNSPSRPGALVTGKEDAASDCMLLSPFPSVYSRLQCSLMVTTRLGRSRSTMLWTGARPVGLCNS